MGNEQLRQLREEAIAECTETALVQIPVEGGTLMVHQTFLFRAGAGFEGKQIQSVSESSVFVPYSDPISEEAEETEGENEVVLQTSAQREVDELLASDVIPQRDYLIEKL